MPDIRPRIVMLEWYRAMRGSSLALAFLALTLPAGLACRRGALEPDAGGSGGGLSPDAAGGLLGGGGAGGGGGPTGSGGGSSGPDGGPGASDADVPTADANCGQSSITGAALAPEILIVLDRSISVDQTTWNNFLSGLSGVVSANSMTDDWGLYAFPQDGPACGPGTVSTTIDVPVLPGNATHVLAHAAAAGTGASATPIAAAIEVGAAYLLGLADQSPKFLMLVTDGAPTCGGTIDALTGDPATAQSDAVAAVSVAAMAGVPTFVVAPSTTTDANAVAALNALAVAGRYPHLPPGPAFATELTIGDQFQLTNLASSCIFNFGAPPPAPDLVTVTFNGATVPRDPAHMLGWDYVPIGALDRAAIEFYGAWCDHVKASRSWTVTIYFGCP
jgi:hypothetical protein